MLIGTLNGLSAAFIPFLAASFASLAVRYRTGTWFMRQQIKWLVLTAGLFLASMLVFWAGPARPEHGKPLSFGPAAPLRLRNKNEPGFKQVNWIKGIEFVTHYTEIGSGYGGYNEDHQFFGYRQSI